MSSRFSLIYLRLKFLSNDQVFIIVVCLNLKFKIETIKILSKSGIISFNSLKYNLYSKIEFVNSAYTSSICLFLLPNSKSVINLILLFFVFCDDLIDSDINVSNEYFFLVSSSFDFKLYAYNAPL